MPSSTDFMSKPQDLKTGSMTSTSATPTRPASDPLFSQSRGTVRPPSSGGLKLPAGVTPAPVEPNMSRSGIPDLPFSPIAKNNPVSTTAPAQEQRNKTRQQANELAIAISSGTPSTPVIAPPAPSVTNSSTPTSATQNSQGLSAQGMSQLAQTN